MRTPKLEVEILVNRSEECPDVKEGISIIEDLGVRSVSVMDRPIRHLRGRMIKIKAADETCLIKYLDYLKDTYGDIYTDL